MLTLIIYLILIPAIIGVLELFVLHVRTYDKISFRSFNKFLSLYDTALIIFLIPIINIIAVIVIAIILLMD